jgi:hypothetical protein
MELSRFQKKKKKKTGIILNILTIFFPFFLHPKGNQNQIKHSIQLLVFYLYTLVLLETN